MNNSMRGVVEEVKLGEGYCPYCYNTTEECTCGENNIIKEIKE